MTFSTFTKHTPTVSPYLSISPIRFVNVFRVSVISPTSMCDMIRAFQEKESQSTCRGKYSHMFIKRFVSKRLRQLDVNESR